MRNLVFRADGKMVNVARRQGQLFVCTGCCCGHTERGHAPVPTELYHNEWERRKLRNRVHLTIGGCLGPCALANVVMLLFDGRALYFHSMNRPELVLALYDYIEQMLTADAYLPPPWHRCTSPPSPGRHGRTASRSRTGTASRPPARAASCSSPTRTPTCSPWRR